MIAEQAVKTWSRNAFSMKECQLIPSPNNKPPHPPNNKYSPNMVYIIYWEYSLLGGGGVYYQAEGIISLKVFLFLKPGPHGASF